MAVGMKTCGTTAGRASRATAFVPVSAAVSAAALALTLLLALTALLPARAEAASLLEKNFWLSGPNYDGVVPECADPKALELIAQRFAETDRMYWHTNLTVGEIDRVGQIAFRPWGPAYQPRRYCQGRVTLSNYRKHTVYYSIIEDGGFIGASWGVEWCITGLDHNFAYAPNCRMARP